MDRGDAAHRIDEGEARRARRTNPREARAERGRAARRAGGSYGGGAATRVIMSGSFLTIVNPAAGGGRARRKVGDALDRLRRAGLELDVRETERAGHARELAREAR